ncbi:MAG TPA: hypothetical protein VLH85_08310 [Levilinea sp.]|nr:hypothetical protein [Levilinea sp.]
MRNRTIHMELGLYVLIFLIAAGFRLIGLDRNSLTDAEASLALQALELARGGSPALTGQPGYLVFTALLFFLTQATEFTARFFPAIAGSVMIWAVYLFRISLGRVASLVLAFFLAIEPGLVAASRQADGVIFTIAFGALGAGFLYQRRAAAGGVFLALALLGGPSVWVGVLSVGLAVVLSKVLLGKSVGDDASDEDKASMDVGSWPWRAALPWLAGGLIILGTSFLWIPTGISALFSDLAAFMSGWAQPTQLPALRVFVILAGYQPLAIFLGIAGIIAAFVKRDRSDLFLTTWFVVGLGVVLIYPGRHATDLVWALTPLWALAARQSVRFIQLIHSDPKAFAGQVSLVFVLLIFSWLNMVALSQQPAGAQIESTRWLTLAGSLLLILVVSILVAWSWSAHSAVGGLVWGVTAVLLIYTISSTVHAAGLGRQPDAELWQRSPYVDQADLLLLTATNISQWNTRARDALELVIVDVPSPALAWAFRDYRNARITSGLELASAPAMVITQEGEELTLAASYTGQSFVWQRLPIWDGVHWLRWRVVRAAPMDETSIILWVRSDLLPGSGSESSEEP